MTLTYGALFAGYGGLEMGVQSVLGGELSWYAEWEKAPAAIMAHHHPGVPNLWDVTKVDWHAVPKVDVITGGSPCQDLSHAGKRKGMKAGTRSGLWASMLDAVDIIRPRLMVWENVRGALSAEADSEMEQCPGCVGNGDDGPVLRALGRVLGDLADVGYDARWYGLRAADVGAAHGRFRIFLFATPAEHPRFIPGGTKHGLQPEVSPERPRQSGQEPADTPADTDNSGLQGLRGQAGTSPTERHGHPLAGTVGPALTLLPTPAVNDMGAGKSVDAWDAWTDRMQAAHGNGNGHGKSLEIEALRLFKTPTSQLAVNGGSQHPDKRKAGGHGPTLADEVEHLLTTPGVAENRLLPTPTVSDAKASGAHGYGGQEFCTLTDATVRQSQDWGRYEAAIRRQEAAFGYPAPSPTEPGTKGQPRLSPKFVEWLMALPPGWVTDVPEIADNAKTRAKSAPRHMRNDARSGISRNDQLKALGNGVSPPQAAAATRAFLHDTTTKND